MFDLYNNRVDQELPPLQGDDTHKVLKCMKATDDARVSYFQVCYCVSRHTAS